MWRRASVTLRRCQTEFQLCNLEVFLQRQPARSFGGIIKLIRKCLFYSKENPKRKQLTSPPRFHKAIIFSANAPSEWRSSNVLILGVNLEANDSLHKCWVWMALRLRGALRDVFIDAARDGGCQRRRKSTESAPLELLWKWTQFFFFLLRIQDWQKKVFWHLLQNLKRLMSRRKDQYLYLKQRWAN